MSIFTGKMKGNYNLLKGKWKETIVFKGKIKGKDHYFSRKTKEIVISQ